MLFLLLADDVAANNAHHTNELYEHKKIMKELPMKTRRDYGSNLANWTAAEREILIELYYATNRP